MVFTPSINFISAAFFTLASAQNHTSNETSSSHYTHWVSPPPGRSTSGIISSCASVLLICSYKCIHSNIPSFKAQHAEWYEWPAIQRHMEKLVWMVVILLGPELVVMLAIEELLYARRSVKLAEKIAPQFQWSLVHGFYEIMGGFAFFDATNMTPVECKDLLGGQPTLAKNKLYSLTLEAYATLLIKPTSSPTDFVTAQSIADRSKSDFITKLFAITQCTWLVVGLISRAATGLPSTQLELGTAAYVLYAIIIYSFWWHKPFDVSHVTLVSTSGNSFIELIHQFELQKWKSISLAGDGPGMKDFLSKEPNAYMNIRLLSLYISAISFSAIHLAAWNWEFPSPVGNLLWRIFAMTAIISSILSLIDNYLDIGIGKRLNTSVASWILVVLIIIYCTARLCLIALILYSLTSMPAGVYRSVAWIEAWPHFW